MKQLRARSWEVIFAPHESPRTALMMMQLKAKHKVSFRVGGTVWFTDKLVDKPMDYPDALRQLACLFLWTRA